MAPRVSFALATIAIAGCGARTSVDSVAPRGTDAGLATITLSCWHGMQPFPPLDKSCEASSDCFVAEHMINCCGALEAIGLNVAAMSAFLSAETTCGPNQCQCDPGPTKAEDGRAIERGVLEVQCVRHVCMTRVR